MMNQGLFIATEGVDGTGKTTTLRYIKKWSEDSGRTFLFTKEPAGTELGARIRDLLLSEHFRMDNVTQAYLFAAARRDHIKNVIKPALKRGKIVICDRFLLSSLAYQGDYQIPSKKNGNGLYGFLHKHGVIKHPHYIEVRHIEKLNRWACDGIRPDLTVYFNLYSKYIRKRLNQRRSHTSKYDKFDRKIQHSKYLNRLRHQYWIAINQWKRPKLIIDARKPSKVRARIMWNRIESMRRHS